MDINKLKLKRDGFLYRKAPAKWEYVLVGLIILSAFFLFVHPDIIETANHAWLLLDNIKRGNFLGFYEDVLVHNNTFYYLNAAHYNIFIYIIFALFELPVFLVCNVFNIAVNEALLYFVAKGVACGFAFMCAALTMRLACVVCNNDKSQGKYAFLAFILSPITMLSAFSMGQYDTICLAFTLLALLFYFQKRYYVFALVMGLAIVCKLFPIFLLIPLLLLCEKRISRLLALGATSMWLLLPTQLLFMGRDGDASVFTNEMIIKFFDIKLAAGVPASVFLLLYALFLLFCYFYTPSSEQAWHGAALYTCLAVYAALFCMVVWHPQWLVLLVPFLVLTTMKARNKTPYFVLDIILCAGFFIYVFARFPSQFEINLLDGGIIGAIFNTNFAGSLRNNMAFYLNLLPYCFELGAVMLGGAFIGNIIFKVPLRSQCLSDSLSKDKYVPSVRLGLWLTFIIGYVLMFILPICFEVAKTVF